MPSINPTRQHAAAELDPSTRKLHAGHQAQGMPAARFLRRVTNPNAVGPRAYNGPTVIIV